MLNSFILPSFFQKDLLLAVADFFAEFEGTCLLFSGGEFDSSEHSFLSLFPIEIVIVKDRQVIHKTKQQIFQQEIKNPWEALQKFFFDSLENNSENYAFGFFGYEMGFSSDPDVQLFCQSHEWTPDAMWQKCAITIIYNHSNQQAILKIADFTGQTLNPLHQHWVEKLSDKNWWESDGFNFFSRTSQKTEAQLKNFSLSNRQLTYLKMIDEAKEWIFSGHVYQINLSQEFTFEGVLRPFDVFRQLIEINPAPFSAYLKADHYTIVSSSPERFLQKKERLLETRPIKGTIQRGGYFEEDQLFKERLLSSEKEKAELLMITDLMRNDLGKISEIGSVKTVDLWRCEAYTNVYHLISIIRSIALKHLKSLEIIRSAFPGGSITGCPKLKAMECIQKLENRSRGIYTGSMGYMTGKGDFDLNIAIRTLVFKDNYISFQVGGGIVIDSDPINEYAETLFKGDSLFRVLKT
ncbi:anthranilate synthase component I family protein [Candidatus Protochlamydia sp. W-9]|uniref:anthranilate synthase component I family protein n=1 Tax=Candidatus Protochlamydia sp. W-9 TaxID=1785087 RepID=UPI00096A3984|nr:anthranilate synthase component I family protein [Candidatus Protochlamydia sp. W-9]